MPSPQLAGVAYRLKQGDTLAYNVQFAGTTNNASAVVNSVARAIYDDGTEDIFTFPDQSKAGVSSGGTTSSKIPADHPAAKNGWLVEWGFNDGGVVTPRNSVWILAIITASGAPGAAPIYQPVAYGPLYGLDKVGLGRFTPCSPELWPTWVFQGTVLEDATVGTHVCTLTVTPAAGFSFLLEYASFVATGSAGLVQTAYITDGAGHTLVDLTNATAAGEFSIPQAQSANDRAGPGVRFTVHGAMQLVLSAATSTASDTQTFAVVCRIHPGAIPVATLADNTGTPTLTVNTNAVF